jgi:cytochrome c6
MSRRAVAWSTLLLTACAGCGGDTTNDAPTSVAPSCTDSGFEEAVSPRLLALERAIVGTAAGHGDVEALGAAAPGLVSASGAVLRTAQGNKPCSPKLVRVDRKMLAATRELSRAGHPLVQLAAAAKKGKDFSTFETEFLSSYYAGTDDLQGALAAFRAAGVPALVKATDGRGVFLAAGCSACHTLTAAGATGTAGPNLDDAKPSKAAVVSAVRGTGGVMPSFRGPLTSDQIQAVAEFVSRSAAT